MDSPIANVKQDGQRVVVEVHASEIECEDLRELVMGLKQLLTDTEANTFVFCFKAVEFLPSACLAQLLMFHQEVKRQDGRVVLLNCQENVAFLLRLARLDGLFELAEGKPADV